jgi:hypothetical protein
MAFTSPFTAVVGTIILSANWNTSGRDNINALWVYTAAGQIVYSTSATTLAKLDKPSVTSLLQNDNTGVPSYVAKTAVGGIHAKGIVDFAPNQDFTTTWANITGATLTLTLTATCTVIVFGFVVGFNATPGNAFNVRATLGGVAFDPTPPIFNGGDATSRRETLPYMVFIGGIGAGSQTINLQCEQQGTTNHVDQGRMIALAFAE